MAPVYIYYHIYDSSGPVHIKNPLSDLTDSKYIGRIAKPYVTPPFNVQNLKLAIAQREGLQNIFEAAGAQLYTVSSIEITDENGLLIGAGSRLGIPVKLKFLRKLKNLQSDKISRFVGKWQFAGSRSNTQYHYKHMSHFTLKKTPEDKIAAAGYERFTTTYTGWVGSKQSSDDPLPAPVRTNLELSDFKVLDDSNISFTRTNNSDGTTCKMSGSLSTDGIWLTLTAKPAGSNKAPGVRRFKHVT